MPTLLLAALVAITMATVNTAAFALRANDLEQRLHAAEAAGVPAASLAPIERQLAEERDRRAGLLPYAPVSGAAMRDPFAALRGDVGAAYRQAMADARARATAALDRRHEASGPNDDGSAGRLVQLARAGRPADADALARRWNGEAARLETVRGQLAQQSGGLSGGMPADVVAATARLSDLVSAAERSRIVMADADAAIVHAQLYLGRPYAAQLTGHAGIVSELSAALSHLQARVDARASAAATLTTDAGLLPQVRRYGAGDELGDRLTKAGAALDAAAATGEESALDTAIAEVARVDADVRAAAQGRLPTTGIACQSGAPAKLIEVHLATQQLVAFQDGCPILRTPVTTGRAALPTGRGTFHIYYKAVRYHMISPWPLGDQFYYPPTWVDHAMEFIGNGTFFHSADWQPDSTYGPGSQYGAYASHGCVHVMDGPLQQLYDWAAIGTTVVVGD